MGTTLNVQAWSMTAADNDGIDAGIGTVANTSAPNTVDDWARGIMASVRKYAADVGGGVTVGGTGNAITITTNQNIESSHQAAGFSIRFKAAATNSGATTVEVDGHTAVAVKRMNGNDLAAGDIVSGGVYDIVHNGTNYTLMQGINPANYVTLSGNNAFTGTNTFSAAPRPSSNDAAALGVSGTAWSDLFLASGAVIDFNAGDVQITHSANLLTLSGGDFSIGTGGVFTAGSINLGHASDTTITRDAAGDIAVEGNRVYRAGGTDVPVTDGGTGASTAAGARTNLGLVIGTNVQAWDADLDAIAALAKTDGNFIVGDGSTWVAESGATARTSLGLGTGDSPQFTAINLGHASDTTLSRASAGMIAVEGITIEPGGARCAGRARKNGTNQTISASGAVKVTFGTEVFDTGNNFSSNALTPPAGTIFLYAQLLYVNATSAQVHIFKNGSAIAKGSTPGGAGTTQVSVIDTCNGTDIYEVYTFDPVDSSYTIQGASTETFFTWCML